MQVYQDRIFTMKIEGTYTLQASPEEIWQRLMDAQVLQRAIPGVEQLEPLDNQKHSITLHIKHAPLTGSYHGKVAITEQHYPYYFCIVIEGNGRQNTISGEGTVHLNARGEHTVIAYKGTLHLGKPGVLLPSILVKGTTKLLLQQFFTALSDILRSTHPSSTDEEGDIPGPSLSHQMDSGGGVAVLPSVTQQSPLLLALVHGLRLGGGDPAMEEQWVQRVRRVGIIAGLLLLVWVGTRLPRRPGS